MFFPLFHDDYWLLQDKKISNRLANIQVSHLGRVLKYIPPEQCLEFCKDPDIFQLLSTDVMCFWTVMVSLSLAQRAVLYELVKEELPPLTKLRRENRTYDISLINSVLTDEQYLDLQMRSTNIGSVRRAPF